LAIFDCDGVLIDSEAISNRVCAEALTESGWPMSAEEAQQRFIGLSFHDTQRLAEIRLGRSLGARWVDDVVERLVAVLATDVEPIPGALDALAAVSAMGLAWRVGSNSSFQETEAKFRRVGIEATMAGRLHSGADIIARGGRPKPAPDVFLEAAAAEGVDPAACAVIEDSVTGVTAAVAAGMRCLGFAPDSDGAALRAAGAEPFRAMADLPGLLRAAMRGHP
jgi:HAD superfamily hydrolase (TIGR01509 family)